MSRSRRSRFRLPLQQRGWAIVIGALMLLALLAPHTSWSVCLTGRCVPATATVLQADAGWAHSDRGARTAIEAGAAVEIAPCCSCGSTVAAPRPSTTKDTPPVPDGPEPRNGKDGCFGCCIDLATQIDEGPLPQPVLPPDLETGAAAILPPALDAESSAHAARRAGFDTGPPRPAKLLERIATTILRE